jgi:hypothetical protein
MPDEPSAPGQRIEHDKKAHQNQHQVLQFVRRHREFLILVLQLVAIVLAFAWLAGAIGRTPWFLRSP